MLLNSEHIRSSVIVVDAVVNDVIGDTNESRSSEPEQIILQNIPFIYKSLISSQQTLPY
jgi:hypothetical protein